MPYYTKNILTNLLFSSSPDQPVTIKGVTGYLDNIQREDGSGKSFNITLNTANGKKTVHLRTVD